MRSKVSSLLRASGAQKFSLCSSPPLCRHPLPATLPARSGLLQLCNGREPTPGFASSLALRCLRTLEYIGNGYYRLRFDPNEDVEPIHWKEEEVEPEMGDEGSGGGVVFRNCPWGEKALAIAHEVLKQHTVNLKLYGFKTLPQGFIYVRLDKITDKNGCPSSDEIHHFSHLYKKRLDEAGARGEFRKDFAIKVSTPGEIRVLKVPDDLNRFKHLPMNVRFLENEETNKILFLESIDADSGSCVWKLADVKENRPLSSKEKLRLPYAMIQHVTVYIPNSGASYAPLADD